ncbi:hypothetical protein SAMN05660831_02057 [Thiohalospira halophila DSM 15071]|uniref:Uncharacterized protein n=1 Tax=Thiohalospira halophila DSM 15071 TaxID=1123397 RepID=A0A1I1U7I3_9GAMM|nr:hypothetical protein [Thiohalospira halophila]SFD66782.1 hypothetical protein SAMN05660831_02057 [Thiohalospira halophila DSM 15071]
MKLDRCPVPARVAPGPGGYHQLIGVYGLEVSGQYDGGRIFFSGGDWHCNYHAWDVMWMAHRRAVRRETWHTWQLGRGGTPAEQRASDTMMDAMIRSTEERTFRAPPPMIGVVQLQDGTWINAGPIDDRLTGPRWTTRREALAAGAATLLAQVQRLRLANVATVRRWAERVVGGAIPPDSRNRGRHAQHTSEPVQLALAV